MVPWSMYVDVGLAIHTSENWIREVFDASGGRWRMEQFTHLQRIVFACFLTPCSIWISCGIVKDWLTTAMLLQELDVVRFYGQTVECVFNVIHIEHVFVDIFHGTFRVPAPMQVALCAPPVNLERVSGQMSEPAISHQSCTASGFAVIDLTYTTHNYIYIYIYHFSLLYTYLRCIILKWWLVEQNSEVKHVDVQSVLVYLCRCLYPP